MSSRACTRCGQRFPIYTTVSATYLGEDDKPAQAIVNVCLCRQCRDEATQECIRAKWRTSQGWADEVDLRDLFW